jgi:hypothetical protein
MTTSSQWAEYTASRSSAEPEPGLADDQSAPAYATAWISVSSPQETLVRESATPGYEDAPEPVHPVGIQPIGDAGSQFRGDHDGLPEADQVAEYAAMPGIPGRGVCLLTLLGAGACAGVDLVLAGGITMFFDLCYVTLCLIAAMSVRRRDLFTTGVLPPFVFAAVVGIVALLSPHTFATFGGASQAFMTGLAGHASALVAGYGVALLTVGSRVSASRVR